MNKMPTLFIGHGSPMNAIEENQYTSSWRDIGLKIPRPKAILSISAHWYTRGTKIQDELKPKMIYDMYGFPKALYEVHYPAIGSPEFSHKTRDLLSKEIEYNEDWGYDHGTWAVLTKMFPQADIPVFQMSIDSKSGRESHYRIGQELSKLRDEGVLILGSGNVVHNLAQVNGNFVGGYTWANEFDEYIKQQILDGKHDKVIEYNLAGACAEDAFYTPEHFYPLLYVLGAADNDKKAYVFNNSCVMGSISMTCYGFGM